VLGGRYRLEERVGAGSMAVIWRGFDEVLDRRVAVKVLSDHHLAHDPEQAIRTEARRAGGLSHPNIGVVYDFGECSESDGGVRPYVVMEWIDGPCLAQLLMDGPLPWRTAVQIAAEVAAALATAHANGVIHRDVKPGNIMLGGAGAKVVDFGISAVIGQPTADAVDGFILGTPRYLAPECIVGGEVGPAADVYALGVLLYEMLAGNPPWRAETGRAVLRAHLRARPRRLPSVPGLPHAVGELYWQALAKNPRTRPSSVHCASVLAAAARSADLSETPAVATAGSHHPTDLTGRTPAVRWRHRMAQLLQPTEASDAGVARKPSRTRLASLVALTIGWFAHVDQVEPYRPRIRFLGFPGDH
jgi:eukaryotic-like serine/threonine-protein kinase